MAHQSSGNAVQEIARELLASTMVFPMLDKAQNIVWEEFTVRDILTRHLRSELFPALQPDDLASHFVGGRLDKTAAASLVEDYRTACTQDERYKFEVGQKTEYDRFITTLNLLVRTGKVDSKDIHAASLMLGDLIQEVQSDENRSRLGVSPQEAAKQARLDRVLRIQGDHSRTGRRSAKAGVEESGNASAPYNDFKRQLAEHDENQGRAKAGITPNDIDNAQAASLWTYQSARHGRLVLEHVKQALERIERVLATEEKPRML
jgi:hypothetical protein